VRIHFAAIAVAVLVATPSQAQRRENINHSMDTQWKTWVDEAFSRNWEFRKSCFPEEKPMPYCSMTLASPEANNKRFRMFEFYDADVNLLGRSMCEESTTLMTRRCRNVETGVWTNEMLDTGTHTWKIIR